MRALAARSLPAAAHQDGEGEGNGMARAQTLRPKGLRLELVGVNLQVRVVNTPDGLWISW